MKSETRFGGGASEWGRRKGSTPPATQVAYFNCYRESEATLFQSLAALLTNVDQLLPAFSTKVFQLFKPLLVKVL